MSVQVRVEYAGNPDRFGTVMAQITQQVARHDLAVLWLPAGRAPDLLARRFRSGTPVYIEWGNAPFDLENFFGYVNHTDKVWDHKRNAATQVRIYAIGASWWMKNKALRVWNDVSASYVARWFAYHHRLFAAVDNHPRIWPHLAQRGLTDFEFLAWLAEQVGYSFYVNKTSLCFINPALHEPRTTYPTFDKGRTLLRFSPVAGEQTGHTDYANTESYGIDPRTGDIVGAKHQPLLSWRKGEFQYADDDCSPIGVRYSPTFSSPLTTAVADHTGDTLHIVEARNNRSLLHARMDLIGNSRVHQSSPIDLRGLLDEFDGLWDADLVVHTLDIRSNSYRMHVEAHRDSGWTVVRRKPVAHRSGGLPSRPKPPVLTRRYNGRWQANTLIAPGCG